MSEEDKKKESGQISRREFLKDAGLVVGGATLGSVALVNACNSEAVTSTVTNTVTASGATVTKTATTTVGAGATVTVSQAAQTVTVTATGAAAKYVCPIDNQEFTSQAALTAHIKAAHPTLSETDSLVAMTVNGVGYVFSVEPHWSLAYLLREKLGLFALKEGCQHGECGACTVVVNNKAVFSCLMLAIEMNGADVLTVEGLSNNGVLGPVQQKFYDQDVTQCGYCTPGFMMGAVALYKVTPKPTLDETREALAGHICMCGNIHRTVNCIAGGV